MTTVDKGFPESLSPQALLVYRAFRELRATCADPSAPSDSLLAATAVEALGFRGTAIPEDAP